MRQVQALKVRGTGGGITGTSIVDASAVNGKNCLIIDDICDGGATFNALAYELRKHGANSVDLFVTHGIFSKGSDAVDVDKIYTTNSFQNRESTKRLVCYTVDMKNM